MPITIADLVDPATTAVLTCEMQRAIIGDRAIDRVLPDVAAKAGILTAGSRLVTAARSVGAKVVHNTYGVRADRAGVAVNTRAMAAAIKHGQLILDGTPDVEVVPELGPEPEDIVLQRIHGYTPFTGTELDSVLRNMGIRTVIPIGVSLNECVLGTCLSAADLGYRIVLPVDGVVAVPPEYGEQVIRHSIAMIATISTVAEVVDAWTTTTAAARR